MVNKSSDLIIFALRYPCIQFSLCQILGTGCIIISPTRELSMQTFGVLKELMKYHHHTYGLIMGGASRATEQQKLSKGKLLPIL